MADANATPDEGDLSGQYMQTAQATTADAAIETFMRRMQSKAKPAQAAGDAAAAAAASGAPPEGEQVEPGVVRMPDGRLRITIPPKSVWERVGSAVGNVAGDAGGGFMEAPTQIVGGVNDAVKNAATGLQHVGDWLEEKLPLGIPGANTGNDKLDLLINRPLEALATSLPDKLKDATTTTGHVVREGARFLTGFVPAIRAFGSGVPGVIAAGAVSDFATMDPDQAGISNLVQSVPALRQPITEYLATDPNDPEALNRLRHAVEGAGFGALAEGVIRGIRAVGTARKAVPELEAQKSLYGEAQPSGLMTGADEAAPLVAIGKPAAQPLDKLATSTAATETGVPTEVAAKGISAPTHGGLGTAKLGGGEAAVKGAAAEPDIFINFARINTGDDIKKIIADVSDAFKGDINKARRGVQSNAETARLADELGMAPEELLSRRAGEPLNAEQSLAARRLLNTSAGKMLELAKKAADPNAGMADQFNFRRMLALHHAIQSEVISARTETARALQAWSIPAGTGNVEMARNIQMLMENMGGAQVSGDLARRMALLAEQGVPTGAIANMVRKGWAATTTDAVKESFVVGLLWNPSTHVVNMASNLGVAFQQVYERGAAAKIGQLVGAETGERVADGEAIAMAYGMITSLKDALRLGARSLKTGETGASMGSKIDLPRDPAISTATIARERQMTAPERQAFAESGMGRAIDFIGEATRVPGRLLGAEDEFFKTIAYRAEVHAQSLRQATSEGRQGPDLWRRMLELSNDPPEHIRISAADAALYSTFQNKPGEWAQALMKMREAGSMNPTFLVLPFIKTPANILRYTFERTPLAPLVGQWRDDIAAGGARAHLAMARMSTGTAMLSVGLDMADNGLITGAGPANQAQKEVLTRQGWQPFSVKIGDKFYSYNRADPIGTIFGAAATIAEMVKTKEMAPEDYDQLEEIVGHTIGAMAQSVVDKTYFKGVTDFLSMIHGAETGEGGTARYIDKQTGSLVPFSSALNVAKRFGDPVTREINSPMDAVRARILSLSDSLPPLRNLWGEEQKPQEVYGRAYDVLVPFSVTQAKDSPIDAEMQRLGMSVDRIKKATAFQNVNVNFRGQPDAYDEYVRLSGNELKHPAWQMGAKDYLDAVVSGKSPMSQAYQIYSDGPDGGKAAFIKNTVSEYRKLAQQEIMTMKDKYPEFIDQVEKARAQQQELKMPVMPGAVAPVAKKAKGVGTQLPR